MKYNLNNKQFITVGNEHGLSSSETIFQYFQSGEVITGEYRGGEILEGRLIGKLTATDRIELLFHCLTKASELLSGKSSGLISAGVDGKLQLVFAWNGCMALAEEVLRVILSVESRCQTRMALT